MNTSLFIAFRYWRAKSGDRFGRLVSNLAALGIVLGVMALIIVLSVMNGLENLQKRNLLTTLPHAVIAPLDANFIKGTPLSLPPFVGKSVEINRTNVIIQSPEGMNAGQLLGVLDKNDDPLLSNVLDLARVLPEGGYRIVVSSRLARQMRLNIGDQIRLMITENSQYTPFGRVPVQRLFTVSEIYFSQNESSDYTLFANLNDVGRLLRLEPGEVQGVRLFLDDPFQVTELAAYFPEAQWKISDWREQKGEFFQAVRMEKNMMGLLISLIILVAVSNIVTSLSLMVVDKQGEIAILQTQGLTRRQIMQIFVWQGLLVGILGTLVGGLSGYLISHNLNFMLSNLPLNTPFLPSETELTQVLTIIGGSLLLSLLCTLYPAYQAAKVQPAQALRYE